MTLAFANTGTAPLRKKKSYCSHWERLAVAVENILPDGTAKQLSDLCGLKIRACFKFLARESSLSSDALVALLDTEHGPEVLAALMGDSREKWWVEFKLMWDRARKQAELDAIEKQIQEIRSGK